MVTKLIFQLLGGLLVWVCSTSVYSLQQHPGERVYQQHCAVCHDNPDEAQARSLDTLQRMIPSLIEHALTEGRMAAQGAALTAVERRDVVNFLGGAIPGNNDWETAMACSPDHAAVNTEAPVHVGTFGLNYANHRALTAAEAGLTTAQKSQLELA